MMKKTTIFALFLSLVAVGAQAQDTLVYNAADGSLTINNDSAMNTYTINGSGDVFDLGAHTPPADFFEVSSLSTLSAVGVLGSVSAGTYNIGSVLDAGLTSSEFTSTVTDASYDGGSLTLQYVPEPGSLALLALGGALLLRRRRA